MLQRMVGVNSSVSWVCCMFRARFGFLSVLLLGISAMGAVTAQAQNFGGGFGRKKIVLVRKLPPTGHISGSTFAVNVTGPGIPGDVILNLKSTIESMIVNNDPRLRSVGMGPGEKPDAVINVQVTSYTQPPPPVTQQQGFSFGKKPAASMPTERVIGMMAATFNAQDVRGSRSIAANTVKTAFDQEFVLPPPANPNASKTSALTGILASHIKMPTGGNGPSQQAEQPPTPAELKTWLTQSIAFDVASNLVNTSEQVEVLLARGGGLDDADTLMDQKLWTRALESLETMTPFPQPDADAYRLYDLGVVNEALGYQAEDVIKARKYLQEAAIDYGKAIDAKPTEKNFLQPQSRIDTALAHYKTLSEETAANAQAAAVAAAPPAAEALTNADVIQMVQAKLDQGNIIDTIQHSQAKFDLSAKGQIELSKGGVNGAIIAAMKQKARGQ